MGDTQPVSQTRDTNCGRDARNVRFTDLKVHAALREAGVHMPMRQDVSVLSVSRPLL